MKKFIFLLVFLIISAGALLFFGWVRIPENRAGVFFSSLTGYEEKLLMTGSYHWRWQKLIPGTSTLYPVDITPHKALIKINDRLPSAEIYSIIMPGNPSFSYSSEISITYKFESRMLLNMIINGQTAEEDFEKIYIENDRIFESLVKSYITGFFTSLKKEEPGTENNPDFFDAHKILEIIESRSAGLEIIDISVLSSDFPDPDLYVSAKIQYSQLVLKREELLREEEIKSARFSAELDSRLQTLEKYGQLLTKYPILLDYLKNNPDRDILKDGARLPLE